MTPWHTCQNGILCNSSLTVLFFYIKTQRLATYVYENKIKQWKRKKKKQKHIFYQWQVDWWGGYDAFCHHVGCSCRLAQAPCLKTATRSTDFESIWFIQNLHKRAIGMEMSGWFSKSKHAKVLKVSFQATSISIIQFFQFKVLLISGKNFSHISALNTPHVSAHCQSAGWKKPAAMSLLTIKIAIGKCPQWWKTKTLIGSWKNHHPLFLLK